MNDNTQAINVANFISDLRAAIDKHTDDAGRAVNRLTILHKDSIRPTSPADKMWAAFLAFHTAMVSWTVEQGIKEDDVKASVMIDIGLRMFLDNTRDQIMQAQAANDPAPKPTILKS